jgi:hypothetical protein
MAGSRRPGVECAKLLGDNPDMAKMKQKDKVPTTIYATKVRPGITKYQHIWWREEGEPAPKPTDQPDRVIHFNKGFLTNKEDGKNRVSSSQRCKEVIWFPEVPN